LHVITPGLEELKNVHFNILNKINEVVSYKIHHKALIKESNPKMTKNRVLKENNKTFLNWFKDTIFGDNNASKMLRKLVDGPKRNVKSTMQNSGVSLKTESNTLLL